MAMITKQQEDLEGKCGSKINQLFLEIKDTIATIQKRGPTVFVGLGVSEIIKDQENMVTVYLKTGDKEDRIKNVKEYKPDCPDNEIENLLTRKDMERMVYYQFVTKKKWFLRSNYDYIFDVSNTNQNTILKKSCRRCND